MGLSVFVDRSTVFLAGGVDAWRWPLTVLHLITFLLFLVVSLAWGRHPTRRYLVASAYIATAMVLLIYPLVLRRSDIPIDWITVLHHGLGRKIVSHLYAEGAHAGTNFHFVVTTVASGLVANLHDLVWLNLFLALVNAAIFLHLAIFVSGPVWGIVWTVVFALNPATFMASFSELPTNLLGLYLLIGFVGYAVLTDPLPQPRSIRGTAYALCAVLTFLTALTRFEVAIIGAGALVLHATHALLGSDSWSAAMRQLRSFGESVLVFFSDHPVILALLCFLSIWGASLGIPGVVHREGLAGSNPFNPSVFSVLFYLPLLLLPIGASIAVFFGCVYASVHFRRFGGLPLSLLILVRMYFAAWFEFFEMGRYMSYILPAVFLLGLFGKRQLDELAERHWSPNWRRAVRIAYLMTWFTLPLPGILEYYTRPDFHRDGGLSQLLLDRDTQREFRYALKMTEDNPECTFVGRVVQDDHGDPKVNTEYSYVVFGAPRVRPVMVPEKDASLADVIARYASDSPCVRLYYGGDCNLNFGDHCEKFIAGRRRIDEQRSWARPYNAPLQSGYAAPELVLATYAYP